MAEPGTVEGLYRLHRGAILTYLIRRVEPAEDAADLLTEVFTIALRRERDIPPADEAKLWLYGVARRVLANHRRGVVRHDNAITRLGDALRDSLANEPPVSDDVLLIRQHVAALPPDDREILMLTAWDGLTPGEAAKVLGLKPATARARLARARRRLTTNLKASDDKSIGQREAPIPMRYP